jgi:hypothetical protein
MTVHGKLTAQNGASVASASVSIWAQLKDSPDVKLDDEEREAPSTGLLIAALAGVEPAARTAVVDALWQRCRLVRVAQTTAKKDGTWRVSFDGPHDGLHPAVKLVVVAWVDSGTNHAGKADSVTLRDSDSREPVYNVDLALEPLRLLTVVARDELGPVASVCISVRQIEPALRRTAPRSWVIDREGLEDMLSWWPYSAYELTTDDTGLAGTRLLYQYWTEVELSVRMSGRATGHEIAIHRKDDGDTHIPIDLEPEAPITGSVLGPEGAPLGSVQVVAFEGWIPISSTTTSAAGTFELQGIAAKKTYHVVFLPEDGTLSTKRAEIEGGAPGQRIVLEAAGTFVLKIEKPTEKGGDHAWGEAATVTVQRQPGGTNVAQAKIGLRTLTSPLRIPSLAAGSYKVLVSCGHGFAPERIADVSIVASETTTRTLTLRKPRTLRATVVDGTGKPVDASVVVDVTGFFVMHSVAHGDLRVEGLPWFEVKLVISATGYKPKNVDVDGETTDFGKIVLEKDDE